jgi:undecaprenyl-diphosphatase
MESYPGRLLALDARLTAALRVADRPGPLRTAAVFLAHSGDSWFWLAGILLFWAFGPRSWRPTALIFALAVGGLAIVVLAIKFLVRRQRPAGEWGGVYRKTDPHSFPSGHAARAFLLAVLGLFLGPPWFGLLLAVWAPLVSLARVAMGVHYLSDVAAGLAIGIAAGLVVIQLV